MNVQKTGEGTGKRELEAKKLQLHWLLQITKAINYNLPSANLFEIYQSVLRDQLNVKKLILFVNEGRWHIPVHFGVGDELPFSDPEEVTGQIQKFSENNVTAA